MTATDAGLMPLFIQLGRARASAMDVPAVLGSVCSSIPGVVGAAGAVLVLVEPPDGIRALTASDTRARWFGETQQRAGLGPLPGVLRSWRPLHTPDLTRSAPPAIAAAAAECGMVSSLALPVEIDGERVGVLQLLGDASRPVEPGHIDVLRPLLDVLAARLADVRALHRASAPHPLSSAKDTSAPPAPAAKAAAPDAPPAETPSPAGRRARPRRGAHAAPDDGADPAEETTRALPAVRSTPRKPPSPRRTGRHSA